MAASRRCEAAIALSLYAASLGCGLVTDFDFQEADGGAAGAGDGTGASHGSASHGSGGSAGASGVGGGGPDCPEGETCIAVPTDWDGPVGWYAGSDPPPDCGTGWTATDAFAGNVAGSVTCSACECSGPVGGGCDAPYFDTFQFGVDACSPKNSEFTVPPNDCKLLPSVNNLLQPTPVIPGQCTASGGIESKSAVTWDEQGRLCAPEEAGAACDGGGVCGRSAARGLTWPCISRLGVHACPSGFEATTTTWYGGVDDTRACSPCVCSVEGGSCTGTMTRYSNSGCSNNAENVPVGTCLSYLRGPHYVKYVPGSSVPGSCVPSGGKAIGGVAPASAITICCAR